MRLFTTLSVTLLAVSTAFAAPIPSHLEEQGVAHSSHHHTSDHISHHKAHVQERGIDSYDSELFERSFEPELEFEELARREPLILTEAERVLNGVHPPNRNKPLPHLPGHNKALPHLPGHDKALPHLPGHGKPLPPLPGHHHKRTPEPLILTKEEQILNGVRPPNVHKPLPPLPHEKKPLPPLPADHNKHRPKRT